MDKRKYNDIRNSMIPVGPFNVTNLGLWLYSVGEKKMLEADKCSLYIEKENVRATWCAERIREFDVEKHPSLTVGRKFFKEYYVDTPVGISPMDINMLSLNIDDSVEITAFADNSGSVVGTVLVSAVAHGLSTGDYAEIYGTAYDGKYIVTKVDDDSYFITAVWGATDTGYSASCSVVNLFAGQSGVSFPR